MSNLGVGGVTIVVPCFNEELRFSQDYWSEISNIQNVKLVFVNDGSTDGTLQLLQKIKKAKIHNLNQNLGKAEAIRFGLNFELNEKSFDNTFIGYLDADQAFAVTDVTNLITKIQVLDESYDAIWSARVALAGRNITRKNSRHIISRILITIIGGNYKDLPYDPQSGFKVFRVGNKLKKSFENSFSTRWFIDLEILARFKIESGVRMKIWEEPVLSWKDVPGSKIKGKELLRILIEFLKINIKLYRLRKI